MDERQGATAEAPPIVIRHDLLELWLRDATRLPLVHRSLPPLTPAT
jgi:hypothetical protein